MRASPSPPTRLSRCSECGVLWNSSGDCQCRRKGPAAKRPSVPSTPNLQRPPLPLDIRVQESPPLGGVDHDVASARTLSARWGGHSLTSLRRSFVLKAGGTESELNTARTTRSCAMSVQENTGFARHPSALVCRRAHTAIAKQHDGSRKAAPHEHTVPHDAVIASLPGRSRGDTLSISLNRIVLHRERYGPYLTTYNAFLGTSDIGGIEYGSRHILYGFLSFALSPLPPVILLPLRAAAAALLVTALTLPHLHWAVFAAPLPTLLILHLLLILPPLQVPVVRFFSRHRANLPSRGEFFLRGRVGTADFLSVEAAVRVKKPTPIHDTPCQPLHESMLPNEKVILALPSTPVTFLGVPLRTDGLTVTTKRVIAHTTSRPPLLPFSCFADHTTRTAARGHVATISAVRIHRFGTGTRATMLVWLVVSFVAFLVQYHRGEPWTAPMSSTAAAVAGYGVVHLSRTWGVVLGLRNRARGGGECMKLACALPGYDEGRAFDTMRRVEAAVRCGGGAAGLLHGEREMWEVQHPAKGMATDGVQATTYRVVVTKRRRGVRGLLTWSERHSVLLSDLGGTLQGKPSWHGNPGQLHAMLTFGVLVVLSMYYGGRWWWFQVCAGVLAALVLVWLVVGVLRSSWSLHFTLNCNTWLSPDALSVRLTPAHASSLLDALSQRSSAQAPQPPVPGADVTFDPPSPLAKIPCDAIDGQRAGVDYFVREKGLWLASDSRKLRISMSTMSSSSLESTACRNAAPSLPNPLPYFDLPIPSQVTPSLPPQYSARGSTIPPNTDRFFLPSASCPAVLQSPALEPHPSPPMSSRIPPERSASGGAVYLDDLVDLPGGEPLPDGSLEATLPVKGSAGSGGGTPYEVSPIGRSPGLTIPSSSSPPLPRLRQRRMTVYRLSPMNSPFGGTQPMSVSPSTQHSSPPSSVVLPSAVVPPPIASPPSSSASSSSLEEESRPSAFRRVRSLPKSEPLSFEESMNRIRERFFSTMQGCTSPSPRYRTGLEEVAVELLPPPESPTDEEESTTKDNSPSVPGFTPDCAPQPHRPGNPSFPNYLYGVSPAEEPEAMSFTSLPYGDPEGDEVITRLPPPHSRPPSAPPSTSSRSAPQSPVPPRPIPVSRVAMLAAKFEQAAVEDPSQSVAPRRKVSSLAAMFQ